VLVSVNYLQWIYVSSIMTTGIWKPSPEKNTYKSCQIKGISGWLKNQTCDLESEPPLNTEQPINCARFHASSICETHILHNRRYEMWWNGTKYANENKHTSASVTLWSLTCNCVRHSCIYSLRFLLLRVLDLVKVNIY
jgi:hypothetical protein